MSVSQVSPCVLLLGGNGNVAKLMTGLKLARGWNVVSVHSIAISSSIDTSGKRANEVIPEVKSAYVVWAAASMSNPKHIDGQTAKSFFKAATESAFKQKILSISAYSARRGPAPWWSKGVRDYWQSEVRSYPDIAAAKTDADEYLVACANKRRTTGDPNFQAISVRPVWFNHNPGSGKAQGGKTKVGVTVSPDNVAHVAIMLLGRKDTRGNFDVAGEGVLSIADAIDQAVEQSITSLDEEDIVRNNALVL